MQRSDGVPRSHNRTEDTHRTESPARTIGRRTPIGRSPPLAQSERDRTEHLTPALALLSRRSVRWPSLSSLPPRVQLFVQLKRARPPPAICVPAAVATSGVRAPAAIKARLAHPPTAAVLTPSPSPALQSPGCPCRAFAELRPDKRSRSPAAPLPPPTPARAGGSSSPPRSGSGSGRCAHPPAGLRTCEALPADCYIPVRLLKAGSGPTELVRRRLSPRPAATPPSPQPVSPSPVPSDRPTGHLAHPGLPSTPAVLQALPGPARRALIPTPHPATPCRHSDHTVQTLTSPYQAHFRP